MDYTALNEKTKSKTLSVVQRLKAAQDSLGMKHSADSLKKITTRQTEKDGLVHRIRFKFKKSGVFVHKGVGKGTPAALAGTTNRKAKEWFNPIIEQFADELMEEMADELVEITFNKLKIR